MKKVYLFGLLSLGLLSSCSNDDIFGEENAIKKGMTISASFEQNAETRSTVGTNKELLWATGDAISVYNGSAFAKFDLTSGNGATNAEFTNTTVTSISGYAVYPANENHSYDGTTLTVNLPAEYGSTSTDYSANTNAIMLAEVADNKVATFKHLGAVVCVPVSAIPSTADGVRLTATKGITGNFTPAEGVITASEEAAYGKSVTLRFKAGTAAAGSNFYFPVPVGTYGFTLSWLAGDVETTIAKAKEMTIARTNLVTMPTLTIEEGMIRVEPNNAQLQNALNNVGLTGEIVLGAGNYDKAYLYAAVGEPKSEVGTNPYTFERKINNLTLKGSKDAKIAGFEITCGYGVVYNNSELFNEALKIESHPGYYNVNNNHIIGTLTFKGITFTNILILHDGTADDNNISIENLVFEDVTFDLEGVTESAAVHLIQENADVNSVTFKNCTFKNCGNIQKPIAFDARTTDDVNITVEGCSFDAYAYNAMQFSGTNSNFTGNITIKDNEINNTSVIDRAVRISTASGYLSITGNTLNEYATDSDGEAMKWGGTPILTFTGNTLNGKDLVVNGGIATADPTVYATSEAELRQAFSAGLPVVLQNNITLAGDAESMTIPANAVVTLDLNGNTISLTCTTTPIALITNRGNLTIKDSGKSGKIAFTFNGTVVSNTYANAISNYGNLVVEGGEISNIGTGEQIGYAIDNYSGATLQVDGGTITASGSNYYDGIRLFCNSNEKENTVTVNAGTISTIWAQNPSDNKASEVKGTVIINGGTIGTTYYENYTTVKVKTGVTTTVKPYGAGKENVEETTEGEYTVHSFVQAEA